MAILGAELVVPRCPWLLLLMTVIVLGTSACKATPTETVVAIPARSEPLVEPPPTVAERAAAQRVDADEIYTVYSRNLIIGANPDQRFLGRLMWVTGVFNDVNHGLPGRAYLELRTHDDSAFVYAALSPDAEPLLSGLMPGTRVELLCRGDGAVGGSPLLRECRGR